MTGVDLLNHLEKRFRKQLDAARSYLAQGDTYLDGHEWLQQFAKGTGLDIASGNFPTILDDKSNVTIGIDGVWLLSNMANGYKCDAARILNVDSGSCDFVVSNNLEGMSAPLEALNEWVRVLKPGGVLALVVSNAEMHSDKLRGPLSNPRKLSCYTKDLLKFYMNRANLKNVVVEIHKNQIQAKGFK